MKGGLNMSGRSNRRKKGGTRDRRISVRAVRRDAPEVKKLSQAVIALAMAQAEKEAQEQTGRKTDKPRSA
jgi:hypothetical protein